MNNLPSKRPLLWAASPLNSLPNEQPPQCATFPNVNSLPNEQPPQWAVFQMSSFPSEQPTYMSSLCKEQPSLTYQPLHMSIRPNDSTASHWKACLKHKLNHFCQPTSPVNFLLQGAAYIMNRGSGYELPLQWCNLSNEQHPQQTVFHMLHCRPYSTCFCVQIAQCRAEKWMGIMVFVGWPNVCGQICLVTIGGGSPSCQELETVSCFADELIKSESILSNRNIRKHADLLDVRAEKEWSVYGKYRGSRAMVRYVKNALFPLEEWVRIMSRTCRPEGCLMVTNWDILKDTGTRNKKSKKMGVSFYRVSCYKNAPLYWEYFIITLVAQNVQRNRIPFFQIHKWFFIYIFCKS